MVENFESFAKRNIVEKLINIPESIKIPEQVLSHARATRVRPEAWSFEFMRELVRSQISLKDGLVFLENLTADLNKWPGESFSLEKYLPLKNIIFKNLKWDYIIKFLTITYRAKLIEDFNLSGFGNRNDELDSWNSFDFGKSVIEKLYFGEGNSGYKKVDLFERSFVADDSSPEVIYKLMANEVCGDAETRFLEVLSGQLNTAKRFRYARIAYIVVTSKDDSGKVHPVSIIKNRGAKSTLDLRTVLNKKTGKPTFVRGLISMFPEDVHDDLMIYISNKFLYGKNLNHLETFSIDVVELEKIFKMHNRRKEYENRKVIFRSGSRFIDIDYKFLDDFIDTFESGRLSTTEVKFSDSDLN